MAAGLDQADPVPALDQAAVQDLVPAVAVQVASAQADQVQVDPVPVDRAQVALAQVALVQVALAVPGNPTARMGTAVGRQAAAALVQPVVVAARVTTSGTELAGCPLQFQTRARRRLDLFRQCAFAPIVRPSALAYTSVKPFTQDAIQVWYE
jgi:hypothetical protein